MPLVIVVLYVSRVNTQQPHWALFWILSIVAVVVSVMGTTYLRRWVSARLPHRTEVFPIDVPGALPTNLYVARCELDDWATTRSSRHQALAAARRHAPGVRPRSLRSSADP